MATLKFAIDRQAKNLVNYDGSISNLPALTQGNQQTIQIQLLDPDVTDLIAGFAEVDGTGFALSLKVFSSATGTYGDAASRLLAYCISWSYDSSAKTFTGTLDLNTAAITTWLGSQPERQAYLHLSATVNSNIETLLPNRRIVIMASPES